MSTIYPMTNAGPWGADDDGVAGDGFFLGNGSYQVTTLTQGPTVDGLEFRGRHPGGPGRGLVTGRDVHLTRGRDR